MVTIGQLKAWLARYGDNTAVYLHEDDIPEAELSTAVSLDAAFHGEDAIK